MKTAILDNAHAADFSRGAGVTSSLRKAAKSISTWNKRRVAIRELYALSDRQLADIGVVRGEIPTLVDKMLTQ